MKDERTAQREIADWLRQTTGAKIYWDRNPPKEYSRFSFVRAEGLPDLLVVGEKNVVVEMKDGTDSSGIYNAMADIHKYWRLYEFEEAEIQTENGDIETIDAFVIATQFSQDGHLFKCDSDDTSVDGDDREKGFRRTFANNEQWNRGMRPQYEYARSEAIPRIMWRYAWMEAETRQGKERADIETGLGVLLSDTLDKNPTQTGFEEFISQEGAFSSPKVLYYDGKEKSQWLSL